MSDRVVTSHTHTHIATSPPAHRVTTLQGMEAMERGRDAAALTGSSGRRQTNLYDKADFFFNIQIWPPPAHHHHIITSSPPRHIELPPCKVWKQWSGAGMQPPSLAPVATLIHPDIITPAHHHIITGQSPCKVWKLTRCRRNGVQGAATRHEISGAV